MNWRIKMQTIFYVKGYSSFNHNQASHVFKTKQEADRFALGLTDAKVYMFKGKTLLDAVNHIF